jgi:hypothetical protein
MGRVFDTDGAFEVKTAVSSVEVASGAVPSSSSNLLRFSSRPLGAAEDSTPDSSRSLGAEDVGLTTRTVSIGVEDGKFKVKDDSGGLMILESWTTGIPAESRTGSDVFEAGGIFNGTTAGVVSGVPSWGVTAVSALCWSEAPLPVASGCGVWDNSAVFWVDDSEGALVDEAAAAGRRRAEAFGATFFPDLLIKEDILLFNNAALINEDGLWVKAWSQVFNEGHFYCGSNTASVAVGVMAWLYAQGFAISIA